jgi:hypothetical protein
LPEHDLHGPVPPEPLPLQFGGGPAHSGLPGYGAQPHGLVPLPQQSAGSLAQTGMPGYSAQLHGFAPPGPGGPIHTNTNTPGYTAQPRDEGPSGLMHPYAMPMYYPPYPSAPPADGSGLNATQAPYSYPFWQQPFYGFHNQYLPPPPASGGLPLAPGSLPPASGSELQGVPEPHAGPHNLR